MPCFDTKWVNLDRTFAGQFSLLQYKTSAIPSFFSSSGSPQQGQAVGYTYVLLLVRLSATLGIT